MSNIGDGNSIYLLRANMKKLTPAFLHLKTEVTTYNKLDQTQKSKV